MKSCGGFESFAEHGGRTPVRGTQLIWKTFTGEKELFPFFCDPSLQPWWRRSTAPALQRSIQRLLPGAGSADEPVCWEPVRAACFCERPVGKVILQASSMPLPHLLAMPG